MNDIKFLNELRALLQERAIILQKRATAIIKRTERLSKEIAIISHKDLKEQILENSESTIGICKMIKKGKLDIKDSWHFIFTTQEVLKDDLNKYRIYKETRKKTIIIDRYNEEKIWEITKLDTTNYRLRQFVMGRKAGEEIENKIWIENILNIKLA